MSIMRIKYYVKILQPETIGGTQVSLLIEDPGEVSTVSGRE